MLATTQVPAAVADVPTLLESIEQTQPDVALIDIRMPPSYTSEGIEATITIRERFPNLGVIVHSQHVDLA